MSINRAIVITGLPSAGKTQLINSSGLNWKAGFFDEYRSLHENRYHFSQVSLFCGKRVLSHAEEVEYSTLDLEFGVLYRIFLSRVFLSDFIRTNKKMKVLEICPVVLSWSSKPILNDMLFVSGNIPYGNYTNRERKVRAAVCKILNFQCGRGIGWKYVSSSVCKKKLEQCE